MGDVADILLKRTALMASALADVPENQLWQWGDFHQSEGLEVTGYRNGGKTVDYRRKSKKKSMIQLDNITLVDIKDKKSKIKDVGKVKQEDGHDITCFNYDGVGPMKKTYTSDFGKTTDREEAFTLGFSQALRIMVRAGNDSTPVGGELETTVTSTQEKADTMRSGESKNRIDTTEVECPEGYDMQYIGRRSVQKQEETVTGWGQIEHEITVGKHWDGKWNDHGKYNRHCHWSSLEDFIKVIKGEGSRDQDLYDYFKKNPAPAALIKRILEPLNKPFSQTEVYDNVTKTKLTAKKLRGPKRPDQASTFGKEDQD